MGQRNLIILSFTAALTLSCLFFSSAARACTDPGPPPDFWIQFHTAPGSCPYDLDGSGGVGFADFGLLSALGGPCPAGTTGCPGDFDNSGTVDEADAAILQDNEGPCTFESVWITIHNYTSFGANPGQFCTCALAALGPVISVDAVEILDTSTGLPVPGFNFSPNPTTSGGFNLSGPGMGGQFVGFLSDVSQAIPSGLSIELRFLVSVPDGTTITEVSDTYLGAPELPAAAPLSVATDEGDVSGNPLGTHQSIQAAASVGLVPHLPSSFSIDFQGPTSTAGTLDSFVAAPISPGDILTTGFFGFPGPNSTAAGIGPFAPGRMVGALTGDPGSFPGGLGVVPGGCPDPEVDALSYGYDSAFGAPEAGYFSVDEWATGDGSIPRPLPNVTTEGAAGTGEASADVFLFLGPTGVPFPPVPPGTGPGNIAHEDGDGLFPSGSPGFGLFEPNAPGLGTPDAGDNLDAYDWDTGPGHPGGPIYFSLDASFPDPLEAGIPNCGTAVANGFSGSDVLVSTAGGSPALFVSGVALGLDFFGPDTDDLDALLYFDADVSGTFTPGDVLAFSVRRGSAVIGMPDDSPGLIPIEEGDVLIATTGAFSPFPAIFVAAEAAGLATVRSGTAPLHGDDLDALDVPEPALGLQLAAGVAFLAGLARRRMRR